VTTGGSSEPHRPVSDGPLCLFHLGLCDGGDGVPVTPRTRDWSGVIAAAIFLAICGAIVGSVIGVSAWKCSERWSGSGMAHRFKAIAGCQVETSPGRWMPEQAVRSLP
jgi:hypothetical protein